MSLLSDLIASSVMFSQLWRWNYDKEFIHYTRKFKASCLRCLRWRHKSCPNVTTLSSVIFDPLNERLDDIKNSIYCLKVKLRFPSSVKWELILKPKDFMPWSVTFGTPPKLSFKSLRLIEAKVIADPRSQIPLSVRLLHSPKLIDSFDNFWRLMQILLPRCFTVTSFIFLSPSKFSERVSKCLKFLPSFVVRHWTPLSDIFRHLWEFLKNWISQIYLSISTSSTLRWLNWWEIPELRYLAPVSVTSQHR